MNKIFKIMTSAMCIILLAGCGLFGKTPITPISVAPPITSGEVQKDHTKASTTVDAIDGNVKTALTNNNDIKKILTKGATSDEPAKNMVGRISPHNDNAISELEKATADIKSLKEQMVDIQTKHLKLTTDYTAVLKSNGELLDANKKTQSDYNELKKANDTITDELKTVKAENKTLKEKLEDLANIINNSLGKLAYILIGFGCLCIVGGVVGFVFTPDKSIAVKAGICGFLLVAAGGIVPSLVKAASAAAVMFFWFLVVLLALYVLYNVYIIMKNEHIKKDLLQTATLLGTNSGATIENSAKMINFIQSPATKDYIDKTTKLLGTNKMKTDEPIVVPVVPPVVEPVVETK